MTIRRLASAWVSAVNNDAIWRQLDDGTQWRKLRRRIFLGAIVLGVGLVAQTMIVYSPRFLIGALFSGRELNLQAMDSYSDRRRQQLLRNICYVYLYFLNGSTTNPYLIPGGEACEAPGGLRPDLVPASKTAVPK